MKIASRVRAKPRIHRGTIIVGKVSRRDAGGAHLWDSARSWVKLQSVRRGRAKRRTEIFCIIHLIIRYIYTNIQFYASQSHICDRCITNKKILCINTSMHIQFMRRFLNSSENLNRCIWSTSFPRAPGSAERVCALSKCLVPEEGTGNSFYEERVDHTGAEGNLEQCTCPYNFKTKSPVSYSIFHFSNNIVLTRCLLLLHRKSLTSRIIMRRIYN